MAEFAGKSRPFAVEGSVADPPNPLASAGKMLVGRDRHGVVAAGVPVE
jgi:hypothetical protein